MTKICGLKKFGGLPTREPTASPVLTKWSMWELILATNFGSPLQMVTKVGSLILATEFGFVPDCWYGIGEVPYCF